ncbi:hypothetical protein ACFE04_012959 [Oxalis oulophora]
MSTTTIDYLPRDILVNVVSFVMSNSLRDHSNIKLSCKDFYKIAEDRFVFQITSLDRFPMTRWRYREEIYEFINRCKESGNPEALYRQGFIEFFSKNLKESGMENLKKAMENGHVDASYVYGIILLCESDDETIKQKGLKILSNCFDSKLRIKQCRERVRRIICTMEINYRLVHKQVSGKNCGSKEGTNVEENSNRWLPGQENNITCCKKCLWEYETEVSTAPSPNHHHCRRFSYTSLRRATASFSQSNHLGQANSAPFTKQSCRRTAAAAVTTTTSSRFKGEEI